MKYITAVIAAVLAAAAALTTLDGALADRIKLYHITEADPADNNEKKSRGFGKKAVISVTAVIFIVTLAAAASVCCRVSGIRDIIRLELPLVMLCGAGCNDFREKRIPNIFPLVMAVAGIVIITAEYFVRGQDGLLWAASSIIATLVVALGMAIAYFLTKKGIGLGDIKLICALSIIGGVYAVCGTLFTGMLLCAAASVFLLATKKKTLKESVAFGPFIYIGYVIWIFTGNY